MYRSVLAVAVALLQLSAFASEPVPTLINGRAAEAGEFPASIWTRSCSATVVGERVVFIAAHCVSNGGKISFAVGASQYSATCTQSNDYRRNNTADYALCETNRAVEGIKYEKLNTDANRFGVGDEVLLSGYGCIRPGGGGGNDGVYRIGEAKVGRMPSGTSNDIVTNGGAALCFGDSGGPAFHVKSDGDRVVISTNSRGDIRSTSYLSATHTQMAKTFFDSWVQSKGYKICGLHTDAINCRGSEDGGGGGGGGNGGPSTDFTIDKPWVKVTAKLKPGFESYLLVLRQVLDGLLDDFEVTP